MITEQYIREWIEKFDPGPTGEDGRTKHSEYTAIRHTKYQNQIIKFIVEHDECSFNQIWQNIPIKRTTCFTIIQRMVKKGAIKREKKVVDNRNQYVYLLSLIFDTVTKWSNVVAC